jgi:hypothetical protein
MKHRITNYFQHFVTGSLSYTQVISSSVFPQAPAIWILPLGCITKFHDYIIQHTKLQFCIFQVIIFTKQLLFNSRTVTIQYNFLNVKVQDVQSNRHFHFIRVKLAFLFWGKNINITQNKTLQRKGCDITNTLVSFNGQILLQLALQPFVCFGLIDNCPPGLLYRLRRLLSLFYSNLRFKVWGC